MKEFVPFVGARLKIARAYDHLKSLNGFVDDALAAQRNGVLGQIEVGTGDMVYRAEMRWQPPKEWGLILGDCVHNLRSALDHMGWDLVILNGERPDSGTEFPIYRDRATYGLKNEAARKLRGVSPEAAQVVEEAQPYHASNPERSPMWALRELDIVDKHRSILLTASIANIQSFGHYGDLPEPPTLAGTAYNDGDEIFRIPARTHAESRIHPTFRCDIALGPDGPYSRLPLRQATTLLYGVVSRHLHFVEYKVLGASPFDTTLYPHVSDTAPVSPRPPDCRVIGNDHRTSDIGIR
jgi:hypothetical protein